VSKLATFKNLAAAKKWGPVTALVFGLLVIGFSTLPLNQKLTAAITFLTAWMWITESVPIPAASLFPLAAFPLAGVLSPQQTGAAYGSPLILLMLGGLILSRGLSASQTHRFLAWRLLHAVGANQPRKLLLGLILASAGLSMWISNTATVLMLLPVTLAITETLGSRKLTLAALLAIAYAASIGGTLTPIGTPPNLILLETLRQQNLHMGFLHWMALTAPIAAILLTALYWLLSRRVPAHGLLSLPPMPPLDSRQRRILLLFAVTALLWMFRTHPLGGWSHWLGLAGANDAAVALMAAFALFVLKDSHGRPLLGWKEAQGIPWGVLLLLAGGISIAKAFNASGLSQTLAEQLSVLHGLPVIAVVFLVAVSVTFLTEINSNTATTAIVLPILYSTTQAVQIPHLVLLFPATISASFAFMMPVATPPNAVIFSSGSVPIKAMIKTGLKLNLTGAVVVTLMTFFYWRMGWLG